LGFKPLADDTELDVEARQVAAWRSMSAAQKAAMVVSASRAADAMALAGIRARFPESTPREQFLRLALLKFGYQLASRAYPDIDRLHLR
jgi:hypothetical protein